MDILYLKEILLRKRKGSALRMNEYQKALDYVEEINANDLGDLLVGEIAEKQIRTLQELVDRTVPIKPFKEFNHIYGTSYYCSNCKTFIARVIDERRKKEIFSKNKGCKHCLHEIDWSNEK